MEKLSDQLLNVVDRLHQEGEAVLKTDHEVSYFNLVDEQAMAKWLAGCRHLLHLLGTHAQAWREPFEPVAKGKDENETARAKRMLGTLKAIREAIQHGLLVKVEDLVFAEAFSDLLEQAEHLLDGGYFLAAGVLGRAVLEEHLRKWCDHAGCVPAKANGKPTMSDFKGELYKNGHLNKMEQSHVESMAAVGNAAAHNLPSLKKEDVERLIRDVREFLVRHPLS